MEIPFGFELEGRFSKEGFTFPKQVLNLDFLYAIEIFLLRIAS
jgi:hypothetical protein